MKFRILSGLCIVVLSCFCIFRTVSAQNNQSITSADQNFIQVILSLFFGSPFQSFSSTIPATAIPVVIPTTSLISGTAQVPVYTGPITSARQILPNPFPALTSNAQKAKPGIIANCVPNKSIYLLAQNATGVPWQYLAGIHMVEGGCRPEQSLVSGRQIGAVEPDVGASCPGQGEGQPYALPGGGCGFRTLLDTAIYAGNLIKAKNSGTVPATFAEAVQAAAFYNGKGNANCGKTDFPFCPPQYQMPFPYWDHIHPMNYFDEYHDRMYVVYCADGKTCQELGSPNPIYRMPGVMTTMRILVEDGY